MFKYYGIETKTSLPFSTWKNNEFENHQPNNTAMIGSNISAKNNIVLWLSIVQIFLIFHHITYRIKLSTKKKSSSTSLSHQSTFIILYGYICTQRDVYFIVYASNYNHIEIHGDIWCQYKINVEIYLHFNLGK